jgi:hypothetical protein
MSRDILSGLPDATRGEIISFMTFFKGERARTLEALDGDFEDCLEDRIRGVDPPFSLEDVTSAVDHLQVVACVEIKILRRVLIVASSTPSTRRLLDGVAMPVPHRSTEPAPPRHRREMT